MGHHCFSRVWTEKTKPTIYCQAGIRYMQIVDLSWKILSRKTLSHHCDVSCAEKFGHYSKNLILNCIHDRQKKQNHVFKKKLDITVSIAPNNV